MENDTIMVTGATGTLGREVLERVRRTGLPVRALTRRTALPDDAGVDWYTGDLTTGTGLDEALAGVVTVIHCASDIRHFKNDVPGFRHLLEAGKRAGVEHVVHTNLPHRPGHPGARLVHVIGCQPGGAPINLDQALDALQQPRTVPCLQCKTATSLPSAG
ncbi:NAD(P)H-binding protein [Streptomyces sp. AP-93]|uniref:NmrA family NAD(P)-binding protein n=1 Tax=Streptomyces sp. AP-93 TaxID=2929048 RepID=UPI001FAED133|nr:NAD(P)H-binding protein [Streptomyces sp. AP-93]MCJ0872555.1 NAD(P)H-binding protein [Streptomyces sp. AP-93]